MTITAEAHSGKASALLGNLTAQTYISALEGPAPARASKRRSRSTTTAATD